LSWVLLLMVLGGCGSAADAAPSWQRPINLSAPLKLADAPVVAMNLAGDTVVVWVDGEADVHAAVRRAGRAFSAPMRVARGAAGKTVDHPVVAIDESGNAIAVWQLDEDAGPPHIVQAAVLRAGGRFSRPRTLSAHAIGPAVAMNAAGDAIVTWARATKSGDVVQAATRPRGGSFKRPITLSAAGQDASFSDVAMNAAGEAIVVWERGRGKTHVVQATLRPAGGSFSRPVDLSAAGQQADGARVAIGRAGDAIVTWSLFNGTTFVVQAATRPARGAFSMPADLSAPDRGGYRGQPAIDGSGQTIVVWLEEDLNRFFEVPSSAVVRMSMRSAGGTFSEPVTLSRPGVQNPRVAMNPAGAVIAVWERAKEGLDSTGVQAALRPSGGSFSSPANLSRAGRTLGYLGIAMDRAGNGIAVWYESHGRGRTLQAAVLRAERPHA
jgi:hypothetical protein